MIQIQLDADMIDRTIFIKMTVKVWLLACIWLFSGCSVMNNDGHVLLRENYLQIRDDYPLSSDLITVPAATSYNVPGVRKKKSDYACVFALPNEGIVGMTNREGVIYLAYDVGRFYEDEYPEPIHVNQLRIQSNVSLELSHSLCAYDKVPSIEDLWATPAGYCTTIRDGTRQVNKINIFGYLLDTVLVNGESYRQILWMGVPRGSNTINSD